MRTAIILHGMPSQEEYEQPGGDTQSQKHWLPWLKNELEKFEIVVFMPDLPRPYEPNYEAWSKVFEQNRIDAHTLLIGHSCGAGFLIRWLSEHPVQVGRLALVAPFLDPDGLAPQMGMTTLHIDPQIALWAEKVGVFISTDDDESIRSSAAKILKALPTAEWIQFTNHGHFTSEDMGTIEFIELRDWLLV